MSKRFTYFIGIIGVVLLPIALYAAEETMLSKILTRIGGTLNFLLGLLALLATVLFIWGVIQFIGNSENAENRKKGRGYIVWGIIALAVIAGAWGFAAIVLDYFGIKSGPQIIWPTINFRRGNDTSNLNDGSKIPPGCGGSVGPLRLCP